MPRTETIDVDKLTEEIKESIRALCDVSVPTARPIRREISKRIAKAEPQQVIALALRVSSEPGLCSVAYELVHYHKEALRSLDEESLERLGRGPKGWASPTASHRRSVISWVLKP